MSVLSMITYFSCHIFFCMSENLLLRTTILDDEWYLCLASPKQDTVACFCKNNLQFVKQMKAEVFRKMEVKKSSEVAYLQWLFGILLATQNSDGKSLILKAENEFLFLRMLCRTTHNLSGSSINSGSRVALLRLETTASFGPLVALWATASRWHCSH